ncbi:MAG TPA: DUF3164 family protein [Paludibacteraceae bacterium]|jgi:Mg2+ and Co2+ transporter CorA|nr:DUF3164 family protein [Paludibacteraceae bacterium]
MEQEQVTMTAQERAEFEAFKQEKAKKEAQERAKEERDTYLTLVDETIEEAIPTLQSISDGIAETKRQVLESFRSALDMKAELFKVKEDQRTHTFTNSDGTKRIMLGQYCLDGYKDTVNEGIAMVKEYIESLAKDDDSRALVNAVLRLLSKDQVGNLKASRVIQLQKMANESADERFKEGVRIINEAYQPVVSKQFIRAEVRSENGEWNNIALGMTEA